MEGGAAKALLTGDLRDVRPVQLAHGRDDRPGGQGRLGPVLGADPDRPCAVRLVPPRPEDLGLPPDVGPDAVLVHHRLEVGLELRLLREEFRPGIAGLEAVAVEVVADVHPRPGVGVLPPGTTDTGVLLDDGERDAGLLQPDAGQQARLPAPDDDDGKGLPRRGVSPHSDAPGVAPVELHLLHEHRDVLVGYLLAHQPGHHFVQQFGRDRLRLGAAAVAVVADDLESEGPRLGLVLFGHVALDLVEEETRRPQPSPNEVGVPGHVDEREQQRRNADVLQGRGDVLVGCGERLTCVRVAHVVALSQPRLRSGGVRL
jgi:hypothetical protein